MVEGTAWSDGSKGDAQRLLDLLNDVQIFLAMHNQATGGVLAKYVPGKLLMKIMVILNFAFYSLWDMYMNILCIHDISGFLESLFSR
jgi:hypothetical protein